MKLILLLTTLSVFAFAQEFQLKSKNTDSNVEIQVIDSKTGQDVYSFKLKYLLHEGINMRHESFKYMGHEHVINIFANQRYLSKVDLRKIDPVDACVNASNYERLYNINSEISFSISLGTISNGFLKQIDVLEGVENIEFKKRVTFRCR